MSAKTTSRDFAQGRVKKLRRMRQPIAQALLIQTPPRNFVARAAAVRALSGAAGRHVRSQGAARRADKVALARLLRRLDRHEE
jgi:hypothetical protein